MSCLCDGFVRAPGWAGCVCCGHGDFEHTDLRGPCNGGWIPKSHIDQLRAELAEARAAFEFQAQRLAEEKAKVARLEAELELLDKTLEALEAAEEPQPTPAIGTIGAIDRKPTPRHTTSTCPHPLCSRCVGGQPQPTPTGRCADGRHVWVGESHRHCSRCGFTPEELLAPAQPTPLKVAELVREAAAKVAEGGRFLHDDAPTARFGRECAAAIRRLDLAALLRGEGL